MRNSLDTAKATATLVNRETKVTETLVNGVSSVLGYVHVASTIAADLAVKGEIRLKSKYLGSSPIDVAKSRLIATSSIQSKLGLKGVLAMLSEDLQDK